MMWALALAARSFLRPHWQCWHDAWGPPAPPVLSQWTCVRSSLLLVDTLNERGIGAVLRSGRPGATDSGLLTAMGWESHAWVEADDQIIDITADQFGHPPVIVVRSDHPAYRYDEDVSRQLTPSRVAMAAIAKIWPEWCDYLSDAIRK